ncbi:MAG: hypothetical protein PVH48_03735 [Cyclobacteriaceae bacterium]|jgi:hypothetical protein
MKKKYKNIKLIVYKKEKAKQGKQPYQKNYQRSDLIELYKAQITEYNKTRDIKWKFNVSIWALLVITTFFKHLNPEIFDLSLIFILFIIALLGHYIFLYIVQRSIAISRKKLDEYLYYLNHYKNNKDIVIKNNRYEGMYVLNLTDYLWIAFQIIITFFILLIFVQA